jgi:preprotein translocase subunit SecA
MEALRVSIGLEAYAQRDPLVQYKSRASEMYHELVANMRLGVISRMFTFRPRTTSQATVSSPRSATVLQEAAGKDHGEAEPDEVELAAANEEAGVPEAAITGPAERRPGEHPGKSKRRRRRH